ncbi:lactosylceramide 4-alpha-galactosyltransferase-like isoform X2 [Eriocheir sinensis]|uniref:lactosylceramide 4-alpha-galactosyltransferase-like isoform X2 n=1 Tax=Eriocheir sinensis TaxID=95602 RepID=UPI0021CAD2C6|nr:lactosylceramide 4-alpha-galactosyltransferase-like isoform X2 [Eriocheir sinensis]
MRHKYVLLAMVLACFCFFSYHQRGSEKTVYYYTKVFRNITPLSSDLQNTGGERQPWWREVVCEKDNLTTQQTGKPLKLLFSWARLNPGRHVWFLLTSGRAEETEHLSTLLKHYDNLQVVGADLDDLFTNTPLESFFNGRNWTRKDSWPIIQMSNMLRVLLLWHFGGVYSDTDMINLQPFTLPLNGIGMETSDRVCNAFLSFHANHPFLSYLMNFMAQQFEPRKWGSIGILAITKAVKKICKKNLSDLFKRAPVTCPGNFTIYPKISFYSVLYNTYSKYFRPGGGKDFDKIFTSKSFGAHFWNKFTKNIYVKVNNNTLIEVLARKFCPFTFRIATAHSDIY